MYVTQEATVTLRLLPTDIGTNAIVTEMIIAILQKYPHAVKIATVKQTIRPLSQEINA